ncbi:putative pilus biogenesis initiator domain protein [Escherichia coli DEC11E]|nr:putative pilus biogenesis initiator domain protein [Escherichia coli DEC11E]
MRNRLIAAILGLFGTLTGVQAAPDVTSEITYDLASGRADYYFWKVDLPLYFQTSVIT